MLLWEIRYNNFNSLLLVNGWGQCQEQELHDLWSAGIPPNLTIPGLRSTRLFSHRVKGCFIFPNPTSPATLRLYTLVGKGLGGMRSCETVWILLTMYAPNWSPFSRETRHRTAAPFERSVTACGRSPGAHSGGTVLFSEGCGSVRQVSCFSHVTTYRHSSPSVCTLLRSMHAYTGDWEILLLSNSET